MYIIDRTKKRYIVVNGQKGAIQVKNGKQILTFLLFLKPIAITGITNILFLELG